MTALSMRKRVLVVGKDARTDAIAAACMASPQRPELYALTEIRIPGLVDKCQVDGVLIDKLTKKAPLEGYVRDIRPDLVIIGPEEPLEAGYVDVLESMGVPSFGPSRELARIEWSKIWARHLLDEDEIPGNPEYRVFDSALGLRQYMEDLGSFVVKPDGLTAGKGVLVFGDHFDSVDDALKYAEELIERDERVLIEEKLEGEEFSLQTITDGVNMVHCPLVQDHKRAYEGDEGPNTGGMGSYSYPDFSLPFLESDDVVQAKRINERVIHALASKTGEHYRGVLYGGFMATRDGVRLIEYNCRFGDPEAMNVLPILRGDFLELCSSVAHGELEPDLYSFDHKATVCKYLVPRSYPEKTMNAGMIEAPDPDKPDLKWYWAACEQSGKDIYLTSSRSGAFVGLGSTLTQAEKVAERAASDMERINPVRHRADIGRADTIEKRINHMKSLRSAVQLGVSG
jgi:phosphoribosylamine--glycine ligase